MWLFLFSLHQLQLIHTDIGGKHTVVHGSFAFFQGIYATHSLAMITVQRPTPLAAPDHAGAGGPEDGGGGAGDVGSVLPLMSVTQSG